MGHMIMRECENVCMVTNLGLWGRPLVSLTVKTNCHKLNTAVPKVHVSFCGRRMKTKGIGHTYTYGGLEVQLKNIIKKQLSVYLIKKVIIVIKKKYI